MAADGVDPRSILRGLGKKVGSACEEFEDKEGGWYIVSELPGSP